MEKSRGAKARQSTEWMHRSKRNVFRFKSLSKFLWRSQRFNLIGTGSGGNRRSAGFVIEASRSGDRQGRRRRVSAPGSRAACNLKER
ncbi:hypothetical protein CR492_07605 [Methylocella silvestris]|uniref:Uncharacterized protein n=1 Tax=Methylocella silvestris TaxID=199596 RepID=A0A2J7TIH5_METSI|nr:hypothetical protein CR492_07605 [Methylocella silvestris]